MESKKENATEQKGHLDHDENSADDEIAYWRNRYENGGDDMGRTEPSQQNDPKYTQEPKSRLLQKTPKKSASQRAPRPDNDSKTHSTQEPLEEGAQTTTPSSASMDWHMGRQLRRRLASTEAHSTKKDVLLDSMKKDLTVKTQHLTELQTTHNKQSKRMVKVIEELLDDRNTLRIELNHLKREHTELSESNKKLSEERETLRDLVGKDLKGSTVMQKRTQAEQKFWDEIATTEVLNATRPPKSEIDKNELAELERTLKRGVAHKRIVDLDILLKKSQSQTFKLSEELKASQRRADEALNQNVELRKKLSEVMKGSNDQMAKQKTQLLGAARRVKYLNDKQEVEKKKHKSQENYIIRLERKILEQNTRIEQLMRREEILSNRLENSHGFEYSGGKGTVSDAALNTKGPSNEEYESSQFYNDTGYSLDEFLDEQFDSEDAEDLRGIHQQRTP